MQIRGAKNECYTLIKSEKEKMGEKETGRIESWSMRPV